MKRRETPYQFFLKHAGYSYDPMKETPLQGRRRCAEQLAEAEKEMEARGWVAEWRVDDERAYCYCDSPTCRYHENSNYKWTTLYCVLYHPCDCDRCSDKHRDILGSLCGIINPDYNYRRVVEAELALDALAEIGREGSRNVLNP